jgi:membrane-associated phospholipid phosphatase
VAVLDIVVAISNSAWAKALAAATLAVTALCATPLPAGAQAPPETAVAWRRHWPKVSAFEYAATGAAALASFAIVAALDQPAHGWHQPLLYDAAVRDLLRADGRAGRDRARAIGDFGYRSMLVFPFLDALVTPWLVHGDSEVWQLLAMDVEAIALAGVIGLATDHLIGRARPSQRECERDPDYERFCGDPDEFGSFISGHTAIAAAGAGLTCAHHLNLPLYGGGAADIAACAATAALALTTAVARVANERHWATDVSAGLLIGAIVGYGLPSWLHYRDAAEPVAGARGPLQLRVLPIVAPGVIAAGVVARH